MSHDHSTEELGAYIDFAREHNLDIYVVRDMVEHGVLYLAKSLAGLVVCGHPGMTREDWLAALHFCETVKTNRVV